MAGTKMFDRPTNLYVKYKDVKGLGIGDPVKFNGVKIGKVSTVKLTPAYDSVVATLEIAERVDLSQEAVALIASDLLGQTEVSILDPEQGKAPFLENKDFINGALETGLLESGSQVVDRGEQLLINVNQLSRKITELTDQIQKLVSDQSNTEAIRATLYSLNRTADNLTVITEKVGNITDNLTGVSEDAASIVKNFEGQNEEVQNIVSNVQKTTEAIAASSDQIQGVLKRTNSAITSVDNMVSAIDSDTGTIGTLIRQRDLHDSLMVASEKLNGILRDFEANPSNYFDDIKIYLNLRKPAAPAPVPAQRTN